MSIPEPASVYELPQRRRLARAALVSLRPRQWTKNLLLFAGIIFAAKLGDLARWAEAFTALAAYCAASSASYLVNDVRDAPHDRVHPLKRARPIARGELSPRFAEALAAGLLFTAVLLVASLGITSILFLCIFFALQAAYTLLLKHVVLLDVMTIAGLFVVRAAAGAKAVEVPISPWLLLCSRADDEEPRDRHHVEQYDVLQQQRVGGLQREEDAEEEDRRDAERCDEQHGREEQPCGKRLGEPWRQLAARDRPGALEWVDAVVGRVTDVVDEVARARGSAIGGQRGERLTPARQVAELCGEDDAREEQQVLRPLPRPQRDERGARRLRRCGSS